MVIVIVMLLFGGRKYGKVGRAVFDSGMTESSRTLLESADSCLGLRTSAYPKSRRTTHKYGPYITPAPFSSLGKSMVSPWGTCIVRLLVAKHGKGTRLAQLC